MVKTMYRWCIDTGWTCYNRTHNRWRPVAWTLESIAIIRWWRCSWSWSVVRAIARVTEHWLWMATEPRLVLERVVQSLLWWLVHWLWLCCGGNIDCWGSSKTLSKKKLFAIESVSLPIVEESLEILSLYHWSIPFHLVQNSLLYCNVIFGTWESMGTFLFSFSYS